MFDDLLNAPYQIHGRGNPGYDCYGLALECCKRAGTPLKDMFYDGDRIDIDTAENDYINRGLNVRKISKQRKGCLVEMDYNNRLHVGYMIDRETVIHTTEKGVKTTCLFACKVKAFYEVIPLESNSI